MWAFWRRLVYGGGFATFWLMVGVVVYYANFYAPASCFDGVLNGSEVETDAGGSCIRIPASQTIPPTVAWAESFEVLPGQYNAAAYIENRNALAATPELRYRFVQYDDNGQIINEVPGSTILPPNSAYPVFEGRIDTGGRVVATTELVLEPVDIWLPATKDATQFQTTNLNLQNSDTEPRLDVMLSNTTLDDARDIEVVATIFNDAGDPVTASRTVIESFPAETSQNVVFTWRQPIARTIRSCAIPVDVLLGIDVSGSMNNDEPVPPQPLTDALAAANTFVSNLQPADRTGLVTFATEATLAQSLTPAHPSVQGAITTTVIDPAEEQGFTNTAAAITLAADQFRAGRTDASARQALVLLTDGLPTAAGEAKAATAAISAATALSDQGVDVHVIGLGAGVDAAFIQSLVSQPAFAHLAPSRADLEDIYANVTASLCEIQPSKIEVIAKTPTSFAELR
jgi:Mg-chelatase subunit ChlD